MGESVRRVGVCSWSLRAGSPAELVERVRACGCDAVQLHLDPLRETWDPGETASALHDAGIAVLSGMMTTEGEDYSTLESIKATGGVRPDGTWAANLAAAGANAELAAGLGIGLVTLHAGFIPHERGDPERAKLVDRVGELQRVFGEHGIRLGLETGQETAATLEGVLAELPGVGVNFDPANMILYGMGDPIAALEKLGPRVVQLHVKDARPAAEAGEWGEEVVVGEGEVDWERFVRAADALCPGADLVIEREAGESRVEDVRTARELIGGKIGIGGAS